MVRKYGWKRDTHDSRDFLFAAPVDARPLPTLVRLHDRPFEPAIWDQGPVGSCTAHGSGYCDFIAHHLSGAPLDFLPSRLAIYGHTRILEGTFGEDDGAMIRDTVKTLRTFGIFDEKLWPYDPDKLNDKGFLAFNAQSKKHKTLQYARVMPGDHAFKTVLSSGYPIVFGMTLYQSFESDVVAKTGMVPQPINPNDQPIGGHCMALVGYDDARQLWIVRNSWGAGWGDKGYCYIPYGMTGMFEDCWQIKRVA
jgi:C1A family cysteine protease